MPDPKPTISDYPIAYPVRGTAPDQYVKDADQFHAHHETRGDEENALATWMDDTASEVEANATSAAESANTAGERAVIATSKAAEALVSSTTALTAAAAAGSAVGLPAFAGKAGFALTVNPAEDGVQFDQTTQLAWYYDEYPMSGVWVKRAGSLLIYVEATGAGESGGRLAGAGFGHGGGGGAFVSGTFAATDLDETETITVGSGGVAVSTGNVAGDPGGASLFGDHLEAPGGGAFGVPAGGGSGVRATATAGTGDLHSGSGGSQGVGGNTVLGGAGGSTSTVTSTGGQSVKGGDGGAGANAPGATAQSGSVPGGGGGGAANGATSGAGGDGIVKVWTLVLEVV